MIMGKPILIVILLSLSNIVNAQSSDQLISMMNGSFTNKEQASANESIPEVNMHIYRIWEDFDEIYFYVEQVSPDKPDEPVRQRVYMLEEVGAGEFKSTIYTFHHAEMFAGKWKDLDYFENFDNAILSEKKGCDMTIKYDGAKYVGKSNSKDCKTESGYATSEVTIAADQLTSWDKGFDASGNQVWGSKNGPYIFKRL